MSSANFDRYDLGTNVREDLADMIYDISPTQTPFMNGIGRGTCSNTYFEWMTDALTGASVTQLVDGADAGSDQSAATTRIGNYCEIQGKVIRVSGRAEKVNKAGRRSELSYQIAQRSKELKRDIETSLTANNASVAGNSTTASETGGLRAWIETNDNIAGDGASGGFSAGIVAAATDGTVRALTEANLRSTIRGCYTSGGEPDTIMVGPTMKQVISEYLFTSSARIATLTRDANGSGQASAIGAVDVFISDFGTLKLIPNRFSRERDVFVLDMSMWEVKYLRPFFVKKLAVTGDAENRQILADYGLCSKNEAASGVVADTDSTAAMTAS